MQCVPALLVALSSVPARADGAFPDEFSIHFPANAPHRIYMGANFGLLVSEDDGATWRYTCEPWVVSGSNVALAPYNVIFYQVTADGSAILANTQINITRSADNACTWPVAGGSTSVPIQDIFADPNDPAFVLALAAPVGGTSYLIASHDGGATFGATPVLQASGPSELLTGMEIARSKPGVVYATSVSTTGGNATFYASTSGGAAGSWTATTIQPIPAHSEPRILAIDPADEKTVYLRLIVSGINDAIVVTTNAGQTFTTVLNLDTQLSSFLRANDGTLFAGTRTGKLYVQPPGGAFSTTPRSAPHLRCLGQRPGASRIYACTSLVDDGYSLATSDDNGTSFQKLMSFTELQGPLACGPVSTNCQGHWERIQAVLGIKPADAGTSGGPPASSSGGHCASAGADGWAAFGLVSVWLRSRRRKRT